MASRDRDEIVELLTEWFLEAVAAIVDLEVKKKRQKIERSRNDRGARRKLES